MRLTVAIVLLLTLVGMAPAQQKTGPVLDTVFEKSEAIPGQPIDLRFTILVPTYMPKPPVWPNFEIPNLLVRLPERSTSPTSQRIDGEAWSGVTRRYRISPMVPGRFSLPSRTIIVTYANPETNAPVEARLTTEALTLSGIIPKGAENLDPFIAAEDLQLVQEIEGEPENMAPGDSISRSVIAKVSGVSPIFLPGLRVTTSIDGIATYPDEPIVEERDERGNVGGTRMERVTFVAQGGGRGEVPPVKVDWYNLNTRKVETALLEGFEISVDGPPVANGEPRDWRYIVLVSFVVLTVLVMLIWLLRYLIPPLVGWANARHEVWFRSEQYAYSNVRRAMKKRDLSELRFALDVWAERLPSGDPHRDPFIQAALTAIGASLYGTNASNQEANDGWIKIEEALQDYRRAADRTINSTRLQPLNPS